MCVMGVNMKTVTTREVQHHFSQILDSLDEEVEIVVTRRGEKIATLSKYNEESKMPRSIPNFREIRERLGVKPCGGENEVLVMRGED